MISLVLYTISKKPNSTARPAASGNVLDGSLIEDTSLVNPKVRIALPAGETPVQWNYAQMLGRYYWIRDWTYTSAGWVASMHVDVLTTYRTAIGNYQAYVLRSASAYDSYLTDSMYPISNLYSRYINMPDEQPWRTGFSPRNGFYIIAVIGAVSSNIDVSDNMAGMVTYLAMDYDVFSDLRDKLYDDSLSMFKTAAGEDLGIGDSLAKMLFNPAEYILDCFWVPFDIREGGVKEVSDWTVGYWKYTNYNGFYVVNPREPIYYNASIQVQRHPEFQTRGAYLNAPPFTRYILHAGPFGDIEIDGSMLTTSDRVNITIAYDVTGASSIMSVYTNGVEKRYYANIRVTIPMSRENNWIGSLPIVQNVLGAARGAGGVIGTVASAAGSVLSSESTSTETIGAPDKSGYTAFYSNFSIETIAHHVADANVSDFGRPLCQKVKINSLSGYVLCADDDIAIANVPAPTQTEIDEIRSYLTGGFYWE